DPFEARPLLELQDEQHVPTAVALTPDGARIASVTDGGSLRVWTAPDWKPHVIELRSWAGTPLDLAWSQSGDQLAISDCSRLAIIPTPADGSIGKLIELPQINSGLQGCSIAWSTDEKLAIGGIEGNNYSISVRDVRNSAYDYRRITMPIDRNIM